MTPPTPFPGDPPITPELVRDHNLTDEEYQRIEAMLGRAPSFAELGVFSALWSEHCSYKHSKPVLKTFPTAGPQVVQGPGENAGVLRLPGGWAVAFKIESHNHPSAVEPYQGAATGVGGILRDVFTMGARPVALLNSLRFGPLDEARNRYLCAGAVRGVGDYGNCVGVPTLGGEVDFGPGYSGNPLVNAMCVGLLREQDLITAAAHGVGNALLVLGSRTGRDGIHGASFASEELTQESERRRPQVQVGDPFTEKLLLEASLELIASGHIVAIQDMGAAGLTSSSAEMAARGGVGVEIDLARVPTREPGMTPYEILLSESQERMLVVAKAERLPQIQAIAAKWELTATPIGRVTDDGMYRATWKQRVVVEIPGQRLIEDCPVYSPAAEEDPEIRRRRAQRPSPESPVPSPAEALLRLLDHPAIASKRWVYEQYDSTVRAGTVIGPGGDAGVIRVRDAAFGIAVTTDGNARYVLLDPFEGGKAAVAEAARNIACTGARPLGITNCLNFGSPERPAVFYQFREACRGIADACRALDTPVTGGNVSFYNESPTGAVDPTPVIGMVGLVGRVDRAVPSHARARGDVVFLVGETHAELGGSVLWEALYGLVAGTPPRVDLAVERRLVDFLATGAERALFRSAHDCSQGGLGVALAEVAMGGPYDETGFGLEIDLTTYGGRLAAVELLFSESQGRAVLTSAPDRAAAVTALAAELGVAVSRVGTVGERGGSVGLRLRDAHVAHPVDRLREVYFCAIPRRMGD
ncbi:MAG: phosphoribosylformylglycinamidine synthase II [Gemmatimonadetes bacterium 13_1_40CM_3_69_22]|nr:MAG: phosphoribosylformylglycinamidine synthase II [Gemmatimonadetes bacterium 13_1_40CM_3_69_22]OLD97278.1 MAG: phosphoribosylformylglycinamidine synthase II [Gemmatimonadetes bacterium 13_1_20CM_4_69_16]